jgi:prepilin peptidase CpaA
MRFFAMSSIQVYLAIALAVSAVAAVIDFRTGHIPNWLTFGAMIGAAVVHVARGAARTGLSGAALGGVTAIAGLIVCAVLPLVLFKLSGMGGGDLKLLAAVGALAGPALGMQAQFFSFIAVLLYAPGKLAYEGKLLGTLKNAAALLVRPLTPKEKRASVSDELKTTLRFGPAVFGGVLATALAHWPVR